MRGGACGVLGGGVMRWVHGRWALGLEACKVTRQKSWFSDSVAVLTTRVAAGGGRNFEEEDQTGRSTQTDRLTMSADMSRSWVGTTWPITEKCDSADRAVLCL